MNSHIRYPVAAQEAGVQGRVIVQFVVEKNGSVGQVKVTRSCGDAALDREALRVVKTLKRFTPAKLNGQPVRAWYTIPVSFKLSN
ncbi:MAG: energy transducer TonB [Muribaculaceae bacterium]|nr:energy transducer TonB [Muribaculaceae bacterium]